MEEIKEAMDDFNEAWNEENDVADYTFEDFQNALAQAIYEKQEAKE